MTGVGSSTGNLNRHLKLHLDKTDPSVKKQSEFMMNFLVEATSNKYYNFKYSLF